MDNSPLLLRSSINNDNTYLFLITNNIIDFIGLCNRKNTLAR